MKKIAFCFLFSFYLLNIVCGQERSFCDGFKDGFDDGKKYMNAPIYITPVCPTPKINQGTYDYGYSLGYSKSVNKDILLIVEPNTEKENTFKHGYQKGYQLAMTDHNKSNYIIPITPIPAINGDTFEAGYIKGFKDALERLGETTTSQKQIVVKSTHSYQTFCKGWEEGYNIGLIEWANENKKNIPLKICPICPIPKINQDSYQYGIDSGIKKAKQDLTH